MTIKYYRYLIAMRCMTEEELEVSETNKCYFGPFRILKTDDDMPRLKDRTSYPYVDFYSTKDQSKEYAIKKILELFEGEMNRQQTE